MSEEFDLNKIRRQARERAEEKPKETKEQQIENLKATIATLEEKKKLRSNRETFLAKSHEEQEADLHTLHEGHPETKESVPTIERYIEFIYGGPDINEVRLAIAKQKLERLQAGSSE